MPPRKFNRRRGRKGFKARRYRRKKPTMLVNRALGPIPQRFITKHKFAVDVITNSLGTYLFNLNSMWDPTRVGGVSPPQPYARDTFAALYNRYRVISCGWRITCANDGVGNALQLVAIPSNDGLTIDSTHPFASLRELPRAKYMIQHSTGDPKLLRGKIHLPSLVGRNTAEYMADDRYQADVAANPLELALLTVGVAFPNGTMITTGRNLQCLFEYTVEWFDLRKQLRS